MALDHIIQAYRAEYTTCYTAAMNETLEFAHQLSLKAGELLLNHFHSKAFDTQLKGDNSAVTTADLEADHVISKAINFF